MRIIDLFSGCGGMSLGFEMAGAEVCLANEIDQWAADTYKRNHPKTPILVEDIRKVRDLECVKRRYKLDNIDGVIGGPPCQGFSLSGNRDAKDPRNSLFMEFVRFVGFFRPKFFVMENVRGILSMRTTSGEKVSDIILSEFKSVGYNVDFSILNSMNYGVPQSRGRVFFIGLKKELPYSKNKIFPIPTLTSKEYVSVEMAVGDLPEVSTGKGGDFVAYKSLPSNDYQKWARENSKGIFNHVAMRHTQRLIARFKIIKWGQSVKDVPHKHSALKRGNPSVKSGKIFSQNNMRVNPHKPAPTVAASFQSNFIHPYLNRNFTAREGARIQSFPDRYVFCGKRTTMSWEKNLSQYQQIGNAVPPLLARAVAGNIARYLTSAAKKKSFYGKRERFSII
ncbi:MAG: DNA cytosine methyltransferase [Candidatus Margulisiibacteriota bacterium]